LPSRHNNKIIESRLIVESFLDIFTADREDILEVIDSDFCEPLNLNLERINTVDNFDISEINFDRNFDFILLNFQRYTPIYQTIDGMGHGLGFASNLLKLNKHLKDDGFIGVITAPYIKNKFIRTIEFFSSQDLHLSAVIDIKGCILSNTTIKTSILLFSRNQKDNLFVGELENKFQAQNLAINFFKGAGFSNLSDGVFVKKEDFGSVPKSKASLAIEQLKTQFKKYEYKTLQELSLSINSANQGSSHSHQDNSIYIPKLGSSYPAVDLDAFKMKHHNLFQVCLNKTVIDKYLEIFFKSKLGQLVLNRSTTTGFIPHLNRRELLDMEIPIPDISEQRKIVATHSKLDFIRNKINLTIDEISLNPTTSNANLDYLDEMMKVYSELSDEDEINAIIRHGESQTTEFKQTLSWDVKKRIKEKYLETSCLKTIAAFLNSEGGDLLIGVDDSGKVNGLEEEIKKLHKNSTDKFLLHFKNLLKDNIGESFYPFITYNLVDINNSLVLRVQCVQSPNPCYVNNEDFYVRANPSTDKLTGPKLVDYISYHFKK